MPTSNVSASSESSRRTFDDAPNEKVDEKRGALMEESLDTATKQMLHDPALQQIIWASVQMVMDEVFRDVFKIIADVDQRLSKRMERLEKWVEIPRSATPLHGMPRLVPTQMSLPRKSSKTWSRSSTHRPPPSTPQGSSSSQPSTLARGPDRGISLFRSPVPGTGQASELPKTVKGELDGLTRQDLHESDSSSSSFEEDVRFALRHFERLRRSGGQSDTGGHMNIVPEAASAPPGQGRRVSPDAVEDDHEEEDRSEASSTKEKRSGRLQRLMEKHKWWSSSSKD